MTHKLKTLPEHFNAVYMRIKNFELRKNDRYFKVGDFVVLQEYDGNDYTGKELCIRIRYIFHGGKYGLDKDYCILGF